MVLLVFPTSRFLQVFPLARSTTTLIAWEPTLQKIQNNYMITEEGLQFLREVDVYSDLSPPKREEQAQPDFDRSEETIRQVR